LKKENKQMLEIESQNLRLIVSINKYETLRKSSKSSTKYQIKINIVLLVNHWQNILKLFIFQILLAKDLNVKIYLNKLIRSFGKIQKLKNYLQLFTKKILKIFHCWLCFRFKEKLKTNIFIIFISDDFIWLMLNSSKKHYHIFSLKQKPPFVSFRLFCQEREPWLWGW
jgi:hypothetical protein